MDLGISFSEFCSPRLANTINDAFVQPMSIFENLPENFQYDRDGNDDTEAMYVSIESVSKELSSLNPSKAQGPDGIPAWLLRENADILAPAVADILNSSFREGRLPSI